MPIKLTENAWTILCKRYLLPKEDAPACERCGKSHETPEDMFWRAAFGVREFYDLMESLDFLPNSPTLFNAQTGYTLSACQKFDVSDSLLGPGSIMNVAEKAAGVMKFGGGVGYVLSALRPKGAPISSTHGQACGPVAVLRHLHSVAMMITQAGKRDAAQMGVLHCDHADIEEFIDCKNTEEKAQALSTFNISVALTDAFMVKATLDSQSREAYILQRMAENAWATGDPGVYFIDTAERANPTPWLGKLTGVNPCLAGSTRMLTDNGLIPIAELAGNSFYLFTPEGWVGGTAWHSGNKPLVNVVLSNGQSILTTPDHQFMVGEEWRAAQELVGKPIEPFVATKPWDGGARDFDRDDLIRLGFLQGDGSFHAGGGIYVNIGQKDADVESLFRDFGAHGTHKPYARYIPAGSPIVEKLEQIGMDRHALPSRVLPMNLWKQSPGAVQSFLRGLYSANGSILQKSRRVTLKSTCLSMVREVQQLLMALGFRPYITTNRPHVVEWPNGTYTSRQSYDLNIVGSELGRFAVNIGFVQQYKQLALEQAAATSSSDSPNMRRCPIVIAVEEVGIGEVYDFRVSASCHSGWANGFLVANCGESPLLDNESCNLGSINLANFTIPGGFDFERLERVARIATRFLDIILDHNTFPLQEIADASLLTRKIGLGVMGWADTLDALGVHYDSEEAVHLGRQIMGTIFEAAHKESLYLAGIAMSNMGPDSWRDRRNATVTCIAPTGTIAILAGVSSGIEPHPFLKNTRTMGDGTQLQEKVDAGGFVPHTATEIDWKWHVRHQSAFQEHTDLAVSKTINMPNDCTPSDVRDALIMMWEQNCKGGTVYRTGSREVEVLKPSSPTSAETESYPVDMGERRRMAKTARAERHSFRVGDTEGYLHLGFLPDGQIGEIFLTGAKQGSTVAGLLDGIAISASLGAQYGVPWEVWADKMRNTNFDPKGLTNNQQIPTASSILDYVAHYIQHHHMPPERQNPAVPIGMVCPVCCQHSLIPEEGCLRCYAPGCGYTKC